MTSVYIHIPFCHKICTYCDFCKLYYDKQLVKSYLQSLEYEINTTYQKERVKTLYIGGGTPSMLDLDELEHLFKVINLLDKKQLQEFTIECNAESLTKEKLLLFKANGVNRLSIGVQTFNNKLLKILGRYHNNKMVFNIIKEAKAIGFNNINIDLIYGINKQTMRNLKKDLKYFLKLDVTHVSFYSLIIEPHTKLYIDSYKEINEDTNVKMYEYINTILKKHHYHHYEISNYAKEGYESKHNLVYWHNDQYYGFGLGSSSYINNKRYENTKNINDYIHNKYIINNKQIDDKEIIQNEMILGLRLIRGINKKVFYQKYHQSIDKVFDIKQLIANKLLIDDGDNIYIPEDKMFISNEVLTTFLD